MAFWNILHTCHTIMASVQDNAFSAKKVKFKYIGKFLFAKNEMHKLSNYNKDRCGLKFTL